MSVKRKVIFLLIFFGVIIVAAIGYVVFQQVKPADKGTVTANQQSGVVQSEDANDQATSDPQATPTIPTKRTDPEILEVITKSQPSLVGSDNQPLFSVTKAQKTANAWYVVTIRHKDPTVGSAKVILKDSGGSAGLVLIAGPGTYFDPADIYLPNEVRVLL